ncbi:12824_t:CDS:2, partial [Acaulospora colombiana]
MAQLHITVVRHAETNANLNHILQGQIDTKLNKNGREQVELIARRLRKMKFDHIYSSDLYRAKKTAEGIAKHHPNIPFTTDIRIRERDIGRLSGLSIYQALDLIKEEESSWNDYGEPEGDFKAQVVDFFEEIVEKHLPKNGEYRKQLLNTDPDAKRNPHILIVTHGGVINKLVKEHLIMDLGFYVKDYLSMKHKAKNTSVTKFVVRRIEKPTIGTTIDDEDAKSVVSNNTTENESNDGNNSVKDDDSGSEKALSTRRTVERKIRLEGEITLWN